MPSKTQQTKMPKGKMQFGIIIPTEVHIRVKHMAADLGWRLSDVYAEGVRRMSDEKHAGKGPEEMNLLKDLTHNVAREHWHLYRELANFIRSKPRPEQMETLRFIMMGPPVVKTAAG